MVYSSRSLVLLHQKMKNIIYTSQDLEDWLDRQYMETLSFTQDGSILGCSIEDVNNDYLILQQNPQEVERPSTEPSQGMLMEKADVLKSHHESLEPSLKINLKVPQITP